MLCFCCQMISERPTSDTWIETILPPQKKSSHPSHEKLSKPDLLHEFLKVYFLVTNVVSNPFFRGWEGMIFPGSQVKLSQQVINLLKTKLNRAAKSTKGTLPRTGQLLIP